MPKISDGTLSQPTIRCANMSDAALILTAEEDPKYPDGLAILRLAEQTGTLWQRTGFYTRSPQLGGLQDVASSKPAVEAARKTAQVGRGPVLTIFKREAAMLYLSN